MGLPIMAFNDFRSGLSIAEPDVHTAGGVSDQHQQLQRNLAASHHSRLNRVTGHGTPGRQLAHHGVRTAPKSFTLS